jgi:signal transduction histidine kinase
VRPITGRLLSVRRSLPLFLAIVVCLAAWQVWLTWRLMEQDRNLAAQRSREHMEQTADLALAQLSSWLGEWDIRLRELETMPPPAALRSRLPTHGSLVLLAPPAQPTTYPPRPLLFVPDPPAPDPLAGHEIETAEKLEFRDENYPAAIEALRPLTERPATRPEALLRMARLERRLGRSEAALADYNRILRETAFNPDGVPYALLGAGARCEISAETCRGLLADLLNGRWPLRRETFAYYWSETNRLGHTAEEPPKDSLEFASRIARLQEHWQQAGAAFSGRSTEPDGSLLMWQATRSRLSVFSVPEGWLETAMNLPVNAGDIRWRLVTSNAPDPGPSIRRSLADAQLAGRIEFSSIASPANPGLKRALWLSGVALMLFLVLAGAYAMHRGVSRELQVARLQSDFVSAVSHEFRSPLTSLRGIAELLSNDRITDAARRRQSYVFLERETGRLQRLVEDLLDFGRMESGRKQYRIEPHDVFGLVRAAVAEFREEDLPSGFAVEMNLGDESATIEADEEALRRAIRNLLENAVKYSPECRTVWVDGRVDNREVAISVRDRGMGIEPREQRDIFQKFVRGAAAKKAGIKGTGIGLSMVRQIVEACGGQIRLESEEGAGSTFTILLPLAASARSGEALA